jgi:hypothetical protein
MFKTGKILFYFKGNRISSESGSVRNETDKDLTVLREKDEEIFVFIRRGKHWLLQKHTNPNSLLYGSRFEFDT